MERPRVTLLLIVGTTALVLASCVAAPQDGVRGLDAHLQGPADFEEAWQQRPDDAEVRQRTGELLAEPLGMDQAVQVALLNHPGVLADIRRIDVAEGELRQRARIADPELDLEAYFSPPGAGIQRWEPQLLFDVSWLFDRAGQLQATGSGIEAARVEAAGRVVAFITRVRHRWVDHVAAIEQLQQTRRVVEAAEALAESAEHHYEAGQLSEDELRRYQARAAEAKLRIIDAEQRVAATEHRLHDALGIDVDERDWSVASSLPPIPDEPPDVDARAEQILEHNVEAKRHRLRGEELEARQRLERRRGWLPRLDVGVGAEIETGDFDVGPALRLNLPLFDRRGPARDALQAKAARAELEHQQALRAVRLAMRDIDDRLRRSHRAVEHYHNELLPVREQLVDDSLRQYNAMTISALQLLEIKREQLEVQRDFVGAQRQFWHAYIDFQHLVAGGTDEGEQW